MLKFISFGSGSSGNCYYLSTGTDALVIDVGVGIRTLKKYCKEYGISLDSVQRILITHDHADHIKSVGSLSHDYFLPVYATRDVHHGIENNYHVQRKIETANKCYLDVDTPVQLGSFLITPFSVPHDSTDNVGYFMEAGGVTFCLITDAGHITDGIAEYIQKAQYLVIEANHDIEMLNHGPYPQYLKDRILSGTGHLCNAKCGEAIAQNMTERLRHVWLCHLSEENNHPELARKTVETVLRSYGVVPGVDFQLDVLRRSLPTGPYDLEP